MSGWLVSLWFPSKPTRKGTITIGRSYMGVSLVESAFLCGFKGKPKGTPNVPSKDTPTLVPKLGSANLFLAVSFRFLVGWCPLVFAWNSKPKEEQKGVQFHDLQESVPPILEVDTLNLASKPTTNHGICRISLVPYLNI